MEPQPPAFGHLYNVYPVSYTHLNPMVAFSDSLSKAVYGDNPRASRLRPQDFEHISYPRIMEMRKERFSDASGFVFTFVGNIQIDSIRPYIEQDVYKRQL